MELLPGTSSNSSDSIWVVLPQGCSLANPRLAGCSKMRGGVFLSNEFSTWSTSRLSNQGLFDLMDPEEHQLGLSGNAYYGFDTIRLGGHINAGLPALQNQLIAGYAVNDFWLGSLGLSPIPLNFSNLTDPVPSLLGSLKDQNLVPSTTWAYTAGAPYRQRPAFGSLTFGGYDASRCSNQSTVSIPFEDDMSRDLLVGLQTTTYDTLGSTSLLSDG